MTPAIPRFGPDDVAPHQLLRTRADNERELSAVPGREVCDFCNSPEPVWVFGCEDVTLQTQRAYDETTGRVGTEDQESLGAWLACRECKFLIDRAEVKKLADRCARTFVAAHPDETKGIPLARLRRDFFRLQQGYWRNRRRSEDRPFRRRGHGARDERHR